MEVRLQQQTHPDNASERVFNQLIAIDGQKTALLNSLELFFNYEKVEKWHKTHHNQKLTFFSSILSSSPLIILSGDVGCGKTALAHSIGTPLGKRIGRRVICYETPSDIRGGGRVGEISNRITDAFTQVKKSIKSGEIGILIIDEADDLATDREQNQAHHEDRAGLNVLIKQIDLISREKIELAVILITNRLKALDPAIIRRALQVIEFERPTAEARKLVFEKLFEGLEYSGNDIKELVKASENKAIPYSFSDLINKVGKQALFLAIHNNSAFSKDVYLEVLKTVKPSPLIK
jgi:SpoVK/Ycf46/Vps4 family AAA+-type ATPase